MVQIVHWDYTPSRVEETKLKMDKKSQSKILRLIEKI